MSWQRATCKTGFAATRSRMIVHRVSKLYSTVADGQVWYCARWVCASNSYTPRGDVVLISDPDAHGGICPRCDSLFAGWAVYRCYDADGRLLYIGSTGDRYTRLRGHEKRTPWWSRVARTETQDYPDEAAARSAEHTAIATESPPYNVRGNWKRTA